MKREIQVWADWIGLNGPQLMGFLRVDTARGKESFSFDYEPSWLEGIHRFALDPDLRLFSGTQHPPANRSNFGLFLDSAPDRWGRVLMERREAALVRVEGRRATRLRESDFLLGVHDEQRLGALRFREDDRWLNDSPDMKTPPLTSLRELEQASWRVQDEKADDRKMLKWLSILLAPGSSIGGARPKAGVLDKKQNLWIAKFPARNDSSDVGAWEMVTHELARASDLNVAKARVERFNRRHHTFLTRRFDREGKRRRHFASAMTLLGYNDGADHHAGVSYLELAEFIQQQGSQPRGDLEELWRRIVFSILVSNTDDHLRNHGFLLNPKGWALSPAYDLNPNPDGFGLCLNISEVDNSLSLDLAREVAKWFRVSESTCEKIITRATQAVGKWRKIAKKFNISRSEQDMMESAFHRAS